jgi:hypothetical protein
LVDLFGSLRLQAHGIQQAVHEISQSVRPSNSQGAQDNLEIDLLTEERHQETKKNQRHHNKRNDGEDVEIQTKLGTKRAKENIVEGSHSVNY